MKFIFFFFLFFGKIFCRPGPKIFFLLLLLVGEARGVSFSVDGFGDANHVAGVDGSITRRHT